MKGWCGVCTCEVCCLCDVWVMAGGMFAWCGMVSYTDECLHSIKFTLISEPQDDDDDCEDMGVAKVSLRQILQQGRDLQEEEVQS